MALTLHEAFVPNCLQILGSLDGLIDKAQAHVKEHGLEDADLIEARLSEDMWNLPWHIRSCWMHSAYSLDQIPTGEFTPDFTELPESWDAMHAMVAATRKRLEAATVEEFEAIADMSVHFVLGGKRLMEFKGQDFLLSFNQPNFMFHATTFYDILRHKGVALGKRDFLGAVRIVG